MQDNWILLLISHDYVIVGTIGGKVYWLSRRPSAQSLSGRADDVPLLLLRVGEQQASRQAGGHNRVRSVNHTGTIFASFCV